MTCMILRNVATMSCISCTYNYLSHLPAGGGQEPSDESLRTAGTEQRSYGVAVCNKGEAIGCGGVTMVVLCCYSSGVTVVV